MARPVHISRALLAPVEPSRPSFVPEPADAPRVFEVAADRARRGIAGAMATVLRRQGSAPATPGQKIYVADDGTCVGTVGGGAVERAILESLEALLDRTHGRATSRARESVPYRVATFKLGAELGMCCGGRVEVLLEPIEALTPLLIVGGGHVATATAPLLAGLGFAVTVVDAREEWARGENGPGDANGITRVTRVVGDYDDVGRDFSPHTAVLVMTHDHALDQRAIEWALTKKFAFVGGVGSRAKAQRTKDRLEAKGFSEADRTRIRMPIGLGIGARLPQEIAVSIAAEMVSWRRSRMTEKSERET